MSLIFFFFKLCYRFANLPYDIEFHDFCRDQKEEIELHSLDDCSHIISNPITNVTYHPYATITSFSSQSFPRRNITRNSSLISNPLDDFYIENELGGIYTNNSNASTTAQRNPTRGLSNEELHRRPTEGNSMTRLTQAALNHINSAVRLNTNSRGLSSDSIYENNTRIQGLPERQTREDNERTNCISVSFHRSGDRMGQVTLNIDPSDNTNSSRSERSPPSEHDDGEENIDEENNNFGALADIRESRV